MTNAIFDGGIELQQDAWLHHDHVDDHLYYRVRWEAGQYSGVWVDEFDKQNFAGAK